METIRRATIVTWLFILAIVILLVMQVRQELDLDDLALSLDFLTGWRLVGHFMVHASILQAIVSLVFLAVFGYGVERRLGPLYTLMVLVAGAAGGALLWLQFADEMSPPLVGPSAAISSLAFCYLVIAYNQPTRFGLIFLWILSQFFFAQVDGYSTTHVVFHLGGAAIGLLLGFLSWAIGMRTTKSESNSDRKVSPNKTKSSKKSREIQLNSDNSSEMVTSRYEIETEKISEISLSPTELGTSEMDLDLKALKRLIQKRPNDYGLRLELVKLHIGRDDKTSATYESRHAIQMLIDQKNEPIAYEFYELMSKTYGHFDLGSVLLARLAEDRITVGDPAQSVGLVEELRHIDPTNRHLPDFMGRMIRLLSVARGVEALETQKWVKRLKNQYPAHPVTKELLKDLGQDQAEQTGETSTANEMTMTFDDVSRLIHERRLEEATDAITANDALARDFDPLVLYGIAMKLLRKNSSLPKAVILLEITVRAHLDHPNTPNLILELMTVYLTQLNKVNRARQWRNFLIERWPHEQAAATAREMMDD